MRVDHARILLLCLLLAAPQRVRAEAESNGYMPQDVDLARCIDLALEYSPVIRQARERIVEAEATTRDVGSSRRPQLAANGSYVLEQQDRLSDFGSGSGLDEEVWNASLEATLSLFSGGQLRANERAQEFLEDAFWADLAAVERDVLLSVAENYYAALLARQRIAVQEEAVRLFEQQLGQARNRFETGAGAKFDLLQADVALANARPPLVRARNDYRVAGELLRQTIGLPYAPGRDAGGVTLSSEWPAVSGVKSQEDSVAVALTTRPELAALEAQRAAVEQDLVASSHGRAPTLDAFAGYQVMNDRFVTDGGDDVLQGWGGGLRAAWPLWGGGGIRSRAARDRSRLKQLVFEQENARLVIETEARRAWFDVEQAHEILQTADRVIEQAQEALRLAENRYRAGGLTQLDVLQSQLELTRARLEKAQAAHDYHVARARLLRAQGLSLGDGLL